MVPDYFSAPYWALFPFSTYFRYVSLICFKYISQRRPLTYLDSDSVPMSQWLARPQLMENGVWTAHPDAVWRRWGMIGWWSRQSQSCDDPKKIEFGNSALSLESLVGGLEHEWIMTFPSKLGMSSSQLTLSPSFFRGVGQPPTRSDSTMSQNYNVGPPR